MNCILFIGNRNKQSLSEIQHISDCMPSDYCIIWAYNFSSNIKGIYEKDVKAYTTLPYNISSSNSELPDYFKIITNNIEQFSSYDFIYVIHSDVHFTGNWSYVFTKCDTLACDYISTQIINYPVERNSTWTWINEYIDKKRYAIDDVINTLIGSFGRFFRISHSAVQFLYSYSKTDITSFAYELYIPTLLYAYKFTIGSIDNKSDKEFETPIMLAMDNTFYPGNVSNKESCAAYPNMLFNGYEEKSNNVIIKVTEFGEQPFEPIASIIIPILDMYCIEVIEKLVDYFQHYEPYNTCEFIFVDEIDDERLVNRINAMSCVFIYKKETGLAETINCGIQYAHSNTILLQSPFIIPYYSRLSKQVQSLQSCDVSLFGDEPNYYSLAFNKQKVLQTGFLFEQYYETIATKFLYTMRLKGLRIKTFNEEVGARIWYGDLQETNTSKLEYLTSYNEDNPELTCIITFRNEGIEVEKTVQSIRSTAKNVSIILVNDASEDLVNYKKVADIYHCTYIKHKEAIGCGASRDDGVAHCQTKYFILLDSHMRFYEMNWDERLLSVMKQLPEDSILSANTSIISKDKDGYYINEDGLSETAGTYGSHFDIRDGYWFDVKWAYKYLSATKIDNVYEIGCVLGAGYCTSVDHWNRIGGLKGLYIYGLDEALMSFKTWAYGGHNYVLYDFYIGHLYRDASPFKNTTDILESNRIFCYNAFIENKSDLNTALNTLKNRIGENLYNKAYTMYLSRQSDMYDVRHVFLQKRKHTLQEFIELNKKL